MGAGVNTIDIGGCAVGLVGYGSIAKTVETTVRRIRDGCELATVVNEYATPNRPVNWECPRQ
jgi:hypothetical protein